MMSCYPVFVRSYSCQRDFKADVADSFYSVEFDEITGVFFVYFGNGTVAEYFMADTGAGFQNGSHATELFFAVGNHFVCLVDQGFVEFMFEAEIFDSGIKDKARRIFEDAVVGGSFGI